MYGQKQPRPEEKVMSKVLITGKTADGYDARRITAHHGNTWMIRHGKSTSVIELHPTLAIEEFKFDLTQEWWHLGHIHHLSTEAVKLVKAETGHRPEVGWYPTVNNNVLDVVKNRPRAEDVLVEECAKLASSFVPARYPSHWQAMQVLQAIKDEYAWLIKGDAEIGMAPLTGNDLPQLMFEWSFIDPSRTAPWVVAWESCSPDEWAPKWEGKADKRIGVFTEPYLSFVLGIYLP